MRAYEFRKYLIKRNIAEADIKNQIEDVRRIEKALDKTAESLTSIESVDSQLKWHILPWKKKELLDSLALYFNFKSSLESELGRSVDLVEDKSIRNPIFRHNVDRTKVPLYG